MMVKMTWDQNFPRTVLLIDQFVVSTTTSFTTFFLSLNKLYIVTCIESQTITVYYYTHKDSYDKMKKTLLQSYSFGLAAQLLFWSSYMDT